MTRPLFAVVFALAALAAPAPAAVIVSIQETGGGVTATTTGSLNTTGLTSNPFTDDGAGIIPSAGFFDSQNPAAILTPGLAYVGSLSGPASFGPGGPTNASSGGGDVFVLSAGSANVVVVPAGYVSGSPLAGTIGFAGATFASLGLTPGTYTYSFNSGANADTIVVQVGPAAPTDVPEPGTLATFGLLALGGLAVRRRKV